MLSEFPPGEAFLSLIAGLKCLKPHPSSRSPQISLDRLYQSPFTPVVRSPVPQQTISLIAFAKGSRVTSRYFLLLKSPPASSTKETWLLPFTTAEVPTLTPELKGLSEAYLG